MRTIFTCYLLGIFFLFPFVGKTQLHTVSGIVTHQKNGKILEDVTIFETISKIGTITDKHGYFRLMLKTGNINISITHDGFKDYKQNLVLINDTILNVQLEPKIALKHKQKNEVQAQISEVADKDNQELLRYR